MIVINKIKGLTERISHFLDWQKLSKAITEEYEETAVMEIPFLPKNAGAVRTFVRRGFFDMPSQKEKEVDVYALPSHLNVCMESLEVTPVWRYQEYYNTAGHFLLCYLYKQEQKDFFEKLSEASIDTFFRLSRIEHDSKYSKHSDNPVNLKKLLQGKLSKVHPEQLFAAGFFNDDPYAPFPQCLLRTDSSEPADVFTMQKKSSRFSLFIDIEPFSWKVQRLYLKPRLSNANFFTCGDRWDNKTFRDITFDEDGNPSIMHRDQYYGLVKSF